MLKVMTIVGTRPELIKMSRVIAELDMNTKHVLVHTGQNYDYELNQLFFEDLDIRKPDHFLEAVGDNAAQTIARVIEKSDEVMEQEKPDVVMLYGDTNSCLAVISAKRRKAPTCATAMPRTSGSSAGLGRETFTETALLVAGVFDVSPP